MSASKRVNFYFFLSGSIGAALGWTFGVNENLKFYKLLNLTGLIYDFIAVILLSYAILMKDQIQDFIAHHISLLFINFTLMFPALFHVFHMIGRGGLEFNIEMIAFTIISIFPMIYVFSSPVLEPTPSKSFLPETRVKILGTLLLLIGFAFQIVASISDISS